MQAAAGAVEDSVDDGGDELAHERGAFGGDQRARAAGQDEPVPVDPGVETEAGKDADELVVRVARSGGRDGLAAPAGAEPAECPRVGLRRAQGGAEQLRHRQEALVRDGPVLPEAEDGAGAARLVRRPRLALDEAVRLEGAHVGAGGVGVDAGGLRQVLEGGGAARREPANEPGANGISDCIDHGNHFLQKIVGNSPRRCVADADPGQRGRASSPHQRNLHPTGGRGLRWPGRYLARAYGSRPSIARLIDQLWFQRKTGRRTGVRMRRSGRSAMTRQSKWMWTLPFRWVSVHTPLPVRSPTTLTSNVFGRSSLVISERVFRW